MTDFAWTDEAVATLRRLDAQGMSFSNISNELGITRNAAIGKARRIGLPLRAREVSTAKPRAKRRTPFRQKTKTRLTNHGNRFDYVEIYEADDVINLAPEISPIAVTFMQLEPHHCRWPVNGEDAQMLFCAAPKSGQHSYCPRHCRLAYNAPAPRQERRPWREMGAR